MCVGVGLLGKEEKLESGESASEEMWKQNQRLEWGAMEREGKGTLCWSAEMAFKSQQRHGQRSVPGVFRGVHPCDPPGTTTGLHTVGVNVCGTPGNRPQQQEETKAPGNDFICTAQLCALVFKPESSPKRGSFKGKVS